MAFKDWIRTHIWKPGDGIMAADLNRMDEMLDGWLNSYYITGNGNAVYNEVRPMAYGGIYLSPGNTAYLLKLSLTPNEAYSNIDHQAHTIVVSIQGSLWKSTSIPDIHSAYSTVYVWNSQNMLPLITNTTTVGLDFRVVISAKSNASFSGGYTAFAHIITVKDVD